MLNLDNESTSRGEDKEKIPKEAKFYSWKEIKESNNMIVIANKVYDVSKFFEKHPGGETLLMHHIGQDVTDAMNAFHTDMKRVEKYMKILEIGHLETSDQNIKLPLTNENLMEDFRKLKVLAEKMNLFEPNKIFWSLQFSQIILLEILATFLISYGGYSNLLTFLIATAALAIVQQQSSYIQHDLGHLSVFKTKWSNHFVQKIVMSTIKGLSASWWNHRHFQHHAKVNVLKKDPEIDFHSLFILGKILPVEMGKNKEGILPYNYQQSFFFYLLPLTVGPVNFFKSIYFVIKIKKYTELLWNLSFFVRWFIQYGCLGFQGALAFMIIVKFLEFIWYMFVIQMNHVPMEVDYEQELDWFHNTLKTTINIEQSWFNDWACGHVNLHIEHHLFPTMPRHNFIKISPHVKLLCKKYNIEYIEKTFPKAVYDVYMSLKESGELWYEAYNM